MIKERIESIISLFGVYDVQNNIYLKAESEAFTEGLCIVSDYFDEILRECFAVTANDYGLSKKEGYFGSPDTYSTVEQRRERLLSSLSVDETAFTLKGLNDFLSGFCDSFEISESPATNQITVVMSSNSRIQPDNNRYIEAVKAFLPAHLSPLVLIE